MNTNASIGQIGGDLLGERQRQRVDEQEPVFGVIDDVGELLRKQAGIDGVCSTMPAPGAA